MSYKAMNESAFYRRFAIQQLTACRYCNGWGTLYSSVLQKIGGAHKTHRTSRPCPICGGTGESDTSPPMSLA